MMGAWFGFNAIANYIAGIIGSHVGDYGAMAIFGGIAATAAVSGVILLTLSNTLIRWMHGAESGATPSEEIEQQQVQIA